MSRVFKLLRLIWALVSRPSPRLGFSLVTERLSATAASDALREVLPMTSLAVPEEPREWPEIALCGPKPGRSLRLSAPAEWWSSVVW